MWPSCAGIGPVTRFRFAGDGGCSRGVPAANGAVGRTSDAAGAAVHHNPAGAALRDTVSHAAHRVASSATQAARLLLQPWRIGSLALLWACGESKPQACLFDPDCGTFEVCVAAQCRSGWAWKQSLLRGSKAASLSAAALGGPPKAEGRSRSSAKPAAAGGAWRGWQLHRPQRLWHDRQRGPYFVGDGTPEALWVSAARGWLLRFRLQGQHGRNRSWQLSWQERLRGEAMVAPLEWNAAEGSVLVGTLDGYLQAIAANGQEQWRLRLGAAITAPARLAPDGSWLAVADGVYALDARGMARWHVPTAGRIHAPPLVVATGKADADYRIVVVTGAGRVLCLSPDGDLLWEGTAFASAHAQPLLLRSQPGHALRSSAAQAGDARSISARRGTDQLIVANDIGGLAALDFADGSPRWHRKGQGEGRSWAIEAPGARLLHATADGRLRALSSSGELLWEDQPISRAFAPPRLFARQDAGRTPAQDAPPDAPDGRGKNAAKTVYGLLVWATGDGELLWAELEPSLRPRRMWSYAPTDGPALSAPVVDAQGELVFATTEGIWRVGGGKQTAGPPK